MKSTQNSNKMNMKSWLIISFIIMGLIIFTFIVGLDSKVTGEIKCVDGMNRINVEGIMCEDSTEYFFGGHMGWAFLCFIPIIFMFYLFLLGG